MGEIAEVEIEDPHILLQVLGDLITEPPEHVEVGLLGLVGLELSGGIVEVGVGVGLDGLRRGCDVGCGQGVAQLACQRDAGHGGRTGNQLPTTHSTFRF